ncbi:enoyl-CoA hydratase/isomerase family protein [Streptomyces somaliensis]|nr:enoyl-CoA hydratase/isomerase family protein [Streptomyces somaliensis]
MNRPAVRNAYRSRTAVEIADAVADFHADDAQRVLVITGSGGSFCSGGDLTSGYEVEHAHAVQFGHAKVLQEGMHRVMRRLELCDKPVIAMISGAAVAGGLSLAMACDVRIADRTARLGDTSGRVGLLLPDEGGAWFFSRAMGPDRALRDAVGRGSVRRRAGQGAGAAHGGRGRGRTRERRAGPGQAVRGDRPLTTKVVKRLVRHAERQTLDQALQEAEFAVELINERDDVREGVSAFVEKRSPRFRGR